MKLEANSVTKTKVSWNHQRSKLVSHHLHKNNNNNNNNNNDSKQAP
jgi:hypothetical protein